MKHFLMITNEGKDEGLKTTKYIQSFLEAQGAQCAVNIVNNAGVSDEKLPERLDADCIIVLGGDGTLLRAAVETMESRIPLLGVNLGMLGYLAEVEKHNLDDTLRRLMEGQFETQSRMMLEGTLFHAGGEAGSAHVLNDIVISRAGSLQMIHFKVSVNGYFLKEYHADGIIISTPTGSTGYNMSAGGPIVEPSARLIVLTPVCCHTLGSRSIVLAPEDEIVIEIAEGKQGQSQEVEATFDGRGGRLLRTGDTLSVRRSAQETRIIKMSGAGFPETLYKKLME